MEQHCNHTITRNNIPVVIIAEHAYMLVEQQAWLSIEVSIFQRKQSFEQTSVLCVWFSKLRPLSLLRFPPYHLFYLSFSFTVGKLQLKCFWFPFLYSLNIVCSRDKCSQLPFTTEFLIIFGASNLYL